MKKQDDYLKKLVTNPDVVRVLDAIFDAVYIVNRDRQIIFWNKSAEAITGHSSKVVTGSKCHDNILNHIDENGNILCFTACPLLKSMNEGIEVEAKIYPLRKNKQRFPALTRVGPIRDKEGKILGGIEVFRDVTKDEDYRILQEKFNNLIRKYVSVTTFEEVIHQLDTDVKGKNIVRDYTVLFIDVAGFIRITENNEPEEVIGLLNDIFSICQKIISQKHGDIDKFMGDGIMITFPDANDAVDAAKAVLIAMKQFNRKRKKDGKEAVHLHFGISSGKVIVGEVGPAERKDLTVFGDPVNVAARIEAHSVPNTILISEATFSRLRNQESFEYKGKLEIRGHQDPVGIYIYNDKLS